MDPVFFCKSSLSTGQGVILNCVCKTYKDLKSILDYWCSFLAHLSRSDKVSFCDWSLTVVR